MVKTFTQRLFDRKFTVMEGTLGLRLARHDLTAANLSNMDTPGFTAKHLNFEKVLNENLFGGDNGLALRQTSPAHLPNRELGDLFARARRNVAESPYGRDEYDNDIIDIDKEMTLLVKNQLIYNTTVQMLAKSFEGLKNAINEGGSQ